MVLKKKLSTPHTPLASVIFCHLVIQHQPLGYTVLLLSTEFLLFVNLFVCLSYYLYIQLVITIIRYLTPVILESRNAEPLVACVFVHLFCCCIARQKTLQKTTKKP